MASRHPIYKKRNESQDWDWVKVGDWVKEQPKNFEKMVRFMFNKADLNKNGKIDRGEAKGLLGILCTNSGVPPPSRHEVGQGISF
jgi:hypothetical protein